MDDFRKIYISYGDKFKDKLSLFLSYGYKATNGYSSAFNVQSSKPTAGIAGWSYTTDNQGNVRYLIGDRGDNRWWDDNIAVKAGYDFSKATKVNLSFVRNRYEYNFTLPLLEKHILTFGGSFRHGWADTKEHNLTNWKDETSKTTLAYQSKGKDRTYAAFFQDEIIILDNLTPYIGFRQDWWEATDGYVNQAGTAGYPKVFSSRGASAFSPKAAIVYMPFEKTSLRTSIGKAFRPPTVYELYRTWRSSRGVTYAGNPDLKPETTTSWDIGIEQGL
jgi:iron complex outermembrane receptor protein